MKRRAEALLQGALERATAAGILKTAAGAGLVFEIPKDRALGDLACPIAMGLARPERRPPRAIAEDIVRHIEDPQGLLESIEIAGPGYINLRFSPLFWRRCVQDVGTEAGQPRSLGAGRKVLVEFVSANPTGPLTVGHGRNAVLGDAIARLLEATGHQVTREYYFNNAGRQMMMLGESVKARYCEQLGATYAFPEGGYQGEYITSIAQALVAQHADGLADEPATGAFKRAAEAAIFADIKQTLERMAIRFDSYFNEDSLYADGSVERVLQHLREGDLAFDRDGAVWLRGEVLGLDKDRVLVKSSGEPAYRLPDIAYHQDKLRRAYDLCVDVLGADHIAEHQEVRAALQGLGLDTSGIKAIIYQFVTLTRGGVQVKMSTRRAEYVTVDELLDEVGSDVVRFFFLTRKADTHLEFDLDLAKKQSSDNPVFYVQYAHARLCSLEKQVANFALAEEASQQYLSRLVAEEEIAVIRLISQYGDIVEESARALEPHRIIFYLIELAAEFHRFYNRHRVLGDDAELNAARVGLCRATRSVIRQGLELLGVAAPETM
ncbi:MAG TPA: arginine--tRNA ligase [Terriglobales bacterium]|nr:arginine--tRNA ligase [Terriglobales bacterium]